MRDVQLKPVRIILITKAIVPRWRSPRNFLRVGSIDLYVSGQLTLTP
jgi:hypothetical protein